MGQGGETPASAITSRIAASVGRELTMFMPRCTPSVIRSGVQPSEFSRFHTAISAPSPARYRQVLVRRAVHDAFAVVVNVVDIGSELQDELHGLQYFGLGSRVFSR